MHCAQMDIHRAGDRAHIAAVPPNGQDSRRAKCGIVRRNKSLGKRSNWLVTCRITVESSSILKESRLFADLTYGKGAVVSARYAAET